MATATRTVTFKSADLGKNASLILLFSSELDTDLYVTHFPTVWRTIDLPAKGEASLQVNWTSALSVSVLKNGIAASYIESYTEISLGNTTSLTDGYVFTPPTSYDDKNIVNVVNEVSTPEAILFGYIDNTEAGKQSVIPACTFDDVEPKNSASHKPVPVLNAYLITDFKLKELDLVRSSAPLGTPIWSADLLSLGQDTIVDVKAILNKPTSLFPAILGSDHPFLQGVNAELLAGAGISLGLLTGIGKRVYSATLLFASADLVPHYMKSITLAVLHRGYSVKFVTKGGHTNATIVLGIPAWKSFAQAEEDMMAFPDIMIFPRRVAITERRGEVSVSVLGEFSHWVSVDPTMNEWYAKGQYTHIEDISSVSAQGGIGLANKTPANIVTAFSA